MKALNLPPQPGIPYKYRSKLEGHYDDGILRDPSIRIPDVLAHDYDLDVRAKYGAVDIAHPIGKASGQLSVQASQVEADAEAGLAFVVLKTVIAEDNQGNASMDAWKVKEHRMHVEPIDGKRIEKKGWTVTWGGRGWEGSLDSYLDFMTEALKIGADARMPVIPSCKFHLPDQPGDLFKDDEYRHTTLRLEHCWQSVLPGERLILEQDFSPTLAAIDAARSKRLILRWLTESPVLIKFSAPTMILGVKLMNALFEDTFQLDMMDLLCRHDSSVDFLVCFNRLFDPERMHHTIKGVAYGGPDLSDRNLFVLREAMTLAGFERRLPISATGDICSGRIMVEYALRGATSGQVHTLFQLPSSEYTLQGVSRSRAVLHELYFHPRDGLIAAMCHIRENWLKDRDTLAFLDLPAIGRDRVEARGRVF